MTSQTNCQNLHRHNIGPYFSSQGKVKSTAHLMKLFKDTQLG